MYALVNPEAEFRVPVFRSHIDNQVGVWVYSVCTHFDREGGWLNVRKLRVSTNETCEVIDFISSRTNDMVESIIKRKDGDDSLMMSQRIVFRGDV